jgi:hypothetical protein
MRAFVLTAILLAGCAQLPPSPADIEAKKLAAVPDKAVIYVVRAPMDSYEPGSLQIDTGEQIYTMNGTYQRIEVRPGERLIEGMSPPQLRERVSVEAGKIYYLRFTVRGASRHGAATSANLTRMSEQEGRSLVAYSQLFP